MKLSLEEYEKFLEKSGVSYEMLMFNKPVKTAKDASEMTDGFIVKTLIITNGEEFLSVVLPGNKMLDFSKFSGFRMATPTEVRKKTGFPPGGVPPIIPEMKTFIDREVLLHEWVIGGGGRENILMKVKPSDIIRVNGAKIIDL